MMILYDMNVVLNQRHTLIPNFFNSQNRFLFFLSTILFWPIIKDFSSFNPPYFRMFNIYSTDLSVSSFRDKFNMLELLRNGRAFGKNSSVSRFRTNFTIEAGLFFKHYKIPITFSFVSSPFVRSKVSEFPFRICYIFSSYF